MVSLLVGSALHSQVRASAMLSLLLCILLRRRGVMMLRTTCSTQSSREPTGTGTLAQPLTASGQHAEHTQPVNWSQDQRRCGTCATPSTLAAGKSFGTHQIMSYAQVSAAGHCIVHEQSQWGCSVAYKAHAHNGPARQCWFWSSSSCMVLT